MEKNIYYYKLDIHEKKDNVEKVLSNQAIYELFKDIYEHSKDVKNYKTYELNGQYYYDFIEFNENEVFLKIGKVNINSSIEIRDKDTYMSGPIDIKDNQQLNTIVYYYMDFTTCIATILSTEGVGYGTAIKKLILDRYKEGISDVVFANIISKNIIDVIMKKDIIGTIEYSYAVPSDEILSNDMHVDRDIFVDIQNKKSMVLTCHLGIERNKSAFDNHHKLLAMFNKVCSVHHSLKSFIVNAKDSDEKMSSFNLLKYRYKDKIEYKENDFSNYDIMFDIIQCKYKKKKNEICELIQN